MENLLGAAAVDDETLRGMVADLLGADAVALSDVTAEVVPYDVPSITTAGRYWVSGKAEAEGVRRPWRMFVKHVQSWARSPQFQEVPEQFREAAAAMVPWRTEAAAYRSDLGDHLPEGLAMPRALGVLDLDEASQAIWLESVDVAVVPWDRARYEQAAHLLGRLAASPAVRDYATLGGHDLTVAHYAEGRLAIQVLPLLRADDFWRNPALRPFEELRPRLLAAADRVDDLVAELLAFPVLVAHGDACPNNLLVRPDRDGFTLIDFGYWGARPVGFDLGQLLVGEVQLGRHGTTDLRERGEACLITYQRGLGDEGLVVPLPQIRRAHAIQLLLFVGFTSFLPDDSPASAGPATRVELIRYSLDLLDETEG